MEGRWLLNDHIDSGHRAKVLENNPRKLKPLITRTPNEYWKIHPAWVQRYCSYLFLARMFSVYIHYCEELNCYVYLGTQVEMGRALTFRASGRSHWDLYACRHGRIFAQLFSGPMEAGDPHVPLCLGRDGSYSDRKSVV